MAEEKTEGGNFLLDYFKTHYKEIAEHLGQYSYLIADSVYLIALGTLAVYILHHVVNRFLLARMVANKRLLAVAFGTLYVLVVVITVILILSRMGFAVSTGGPIAVIAVLLVATILYFIIPFLPRLPFIPGHMIETANVMGVVTNVSSFYTTIRKFDGTLVFVPNAGLMAKTISNYTYVPHRRIEFKISVKPDSDLNGAMAAILAVANSNHLTLEDPAPALYAVEASASGIDLMLFCWVENADFFTARSELWLQLIEQAQEDGPIILSLPAQEVVVQGVGQKLGVD